MTRYMLDTNIVSHLFREHSEVSRQVASQPVGSLCISAVTEGELLFGVARRPEAKKLRRVVEAFLLRVDVLTWDRRAAQEYGLTRARLERAGIGVASLDLMIAAHAQSVGATMVTNDSAFSRIPGLDILDWTVPPPP